MKVRLTLTMLHDLAVQEIGFCIGIHWRSVTGSCVPPGMISARCRLAYVLFSGFAPAERFHTLLARQQADRLPRSHIRHVLLTHGTRTITGVAVVAVVSPDRDDAEGFQRAPVHRRQPGYQRFFQAQAARNRPPSAWWDEHDDTDGLHEARFTNEPEPQAFSASDDIGLEILLDQLEAAYDAKLWWYGTPGRMTKYPPKLGSVRELFAYARKQELTPEESARRNRERQRDQWLTEQHARDQQRQQALDADHAEVAAALHTPRPGAAHAADQDWLTTEQTLRARKGLRVVYRDAAGRPRRRRSA